jgi:signal transduction histidine kinase
MATGASRLVPRRWLKRSASSARLRLTLMFSGMFLLLGTAVIVIISVLVRTTTTVQAVASPSQTLAGPAGPAIHAAFTQHSADLAGLLAVSWVALVVTAGASAVLGWFAAGRVLRPLRKMTATARTISAGNLHQRLAVSGPSDEFKQLGDTVDDLLGRLEASFASQRRFVANAAHELRTPLTLERALIQVALADPHASASALRTTFEELLASGRAQERLIESLLTLATSERGVEGREPVDLRAAAEQALERANGEIQHRELVLRADLGPATTLGDKALVDRLVANLIDNAVRYNRPGGMIDVKTATDSGVAVVSVANDGPPVPAAELGRLFEPFQRLEQDRTAPDEVHGLGLSIVRAIASAHDAELHAEPRAAGGLLVSVRFRAAPRITQP